MQINADRFAKHKSENEEIDNRNLEYDPYGESEESWILSTCTRCIDEILNLK